MIETVLEQQKAVAQVLSNDKNNRHLVPTWQDIDVLESINKALSPLQNFTDAISGETYVSVSSVKPVLHLLNTQILIRDEEDTTLTHSIKLKVLQYLNKKWDQSTEDLLDMASFMDPRFKTRCVSEQSISILKARVQSEMNEIA
ncbi:hypothetical protein DPEC_G00158490 [Dallia pectoralis]|uniref:Uncharacterized protein n=1 Tax=Dallia pectoralis TaxID=75939 RepID=A0ACC2GLN2_DALPE|nr:hypothetical protein DPEC_G00158490 [Dallia pectoralis]